MKKAVAAADAESFDTRFAAKIAALGDWRGEMLAKVRATVRAADPEILEEWKWVKPTSPGVPVWSHGGIVCTGETYKGAVKMTFARGAALADPDRLFNAGLAGNVRRAIDVHEGEKLDETALKRLIRAAVELNLVGKGGAFGGSGRSDAPAPHATNAFDLRGHPLRTRPAGRRPR